MTTNLHTKPAVAAIIGVIVGVLTLLEAFFGSGHLPSSAEVASILGGSGITLGSVAAFVASHLGLTKALIGAGVLPAAPAAPVVIPAAPTPAAVPAAAPAPAAAAPTVPPAA